MAAASTAPFLSAALVLCLAGVAKLRSPDAARRALAVIGVPRGEGLVRTFAAGELMLGAVCLVRPGLITAIAAAWLYAMFAAVSLALARRRAACGCFGERDAPATIGHSLLNGLLALVAVAAAVSSPHGLGWMLGRPPQVAAVLVIGTMAATYGIVLAYTAFPQAWSSWSKAQA